MTLTIRLRRASRSANAIAEPTPCGYRPCLCKISLITKIVSCPQSKNEQEKDASNLIITRRWSSEYTRTVLICACSRVAKARCKTKLKSELKRNLSLNRGRGGAAPREGRPGDGGAAPSVQGKGGGRSPRRPHKGLCWASFYSSGPSFFSSMTKFSSLARAQVIGPGGGAWGGGAGEGAAGVDVLVVSSSALNMSTE